MRIVSIIPMAFVAGLLLVAADATEAPTGGVYASLTVANASACARACEDDGICMTWTQRANGACDLSAIVSGTPPSDAVATGLSSRAPVFAQLQAPMLLPPRIVEANGHPEPPAAEPESDVAEAEAAPMLLGGPNEGDLRLRLGAQR